MTRFTLGQRAFIAFCVLLAIVAAGVAVALWPRAAKAHGSASWIMKGEHAECCGERDCRALPDGAVKWTPKGYLIKHRGQTVPEDRTYPSVDHHYWICVDMDVEDEFKPLKCLFVPVRGM